MNELPHATKAAILIVNGGDSPKDNRWIRLCLERIAMYTVYPNYHLYIWNNRLGDPVLENWLLSQPRLTLLSAASYEKLHHPHRTPLQRLYHLARQEGAHSIVTLDSDAHPLRSGWLTELLARLDEGTVLAGVWRDEMVPAIRPHIHPSCLCTTVDFIERYQLRFDFDNTHSQEKTDTLAHFTWVAEAAGLPVHKLKRSNQRNFHYWMGGIYGDMIYHHVAASRERVLFHNSGDKGVIQSDQHRHLRDGTAALLFSEYDTYLAWLQGQAIDPAFDHKLRRLMAQAETIHTPPRWLQRLHSNYLQAEMGRKIRRKIKLATEKHPLIYRGINKLRKLTDRRKPRDESGSPRPINALVTPFQPEQLAPAPAYGWRSTGPDFVGVGAPKCGTTWWYQLLQEHPQIVPHRVSLTNPANKELQYFLHFQYHGLSTEAIAPYRHAFAAPPGAICGEFSTQYLGYPTCLEHLAVAVPDTKIMVILRNPVDRLVSHLNHMITKRGQRFFANLNPQQQYLLNTYSFYIEATFHSLYSIGLTRLFHYFSRERVLVLQYERLAQSPQEELARTYRFLGVDDRFRVNNYREEVNRGTYAIEKPDAEERQRLAVYFKEDAQRVFTLCPEIDPAMWPEFLER